MTAHVPTRQPFAALDSPRLQTLSSIKNRQNAITQSLASPSKNLSLSPPVKRRYEAHFDDDNFDAENIDPSIFNSPSKRSKGTDGTPAKKSAFVLTDAPKPASTFLAPLNTPFHSTGKTAFQSPRVKTTPISASRGSPKHKRVGLLNSSKRRSSAPFTRIDPPSFSRPSRTPGAGLPFSIDAALSGTLSSHTPKPAVSKDVEIDIEPPISIASSAPMLEDAMPKGWFFEIHEDTPEEEAANLMEHSACVLDISSDDDATTKLDAERRDKGKENVPPPDWAGPVASNAAAASGVVEAEVPVKSAKFRREKLAPGPDAMVEDVLRSPLGDLKTRDFYPSEDKETSEEPTDSTVPPPCAADAPSKATFDFIAPPVDDDAATEINVETAAPASTEESMTFSVWDSEKANVDTTISSEAAEQVDASQIPLPQESSPEDVAVESIA